MKNKKIKIALILSTMFLVNTSFAQVVLDNVNGTVQIGNSTTHAMVSSTNPTSSAIAIGGDPNGFFQTIATNGGIGIGIGAQAIGKYSSIGIGPYSKASGNYALCVGSNCSAKGDLSASTGAGSSADNFNSASYGAFSATTRNNEFSVGGALAGTRLVANVSDAQLGTDATNLNQLNTGLSNTLFQANSYTDSAVANSEVTMKAYTDNAINGLDKKINGVGALALASSGLTFNPAGSSNQFAMSVSTYKSVIGISAGFFHLSDNKRNLINVRLAGAGHAGMGAVISVNHSF